MKQIYDPQTVIQFYQSKSKESKKFQVIDNFLSKYRYNEIGSKNKGF